jgi:hypothetical protein
MEGIEARIAKHTGSRILLFKAANTIVSMAREVIIAHTNIQKNSSNVV